uniref:NADH-ubiquinone oxidoreductase chain 3 n=1 Tax=Coleoptera sp. ACP-2013 TaxID=2485033 RepID=A0A3G3MEN6_9COLE|nr:NADH dehydrogenase subunit 3 [Coleoptera sp. ACP-2013]
MKILLNMSLIFISILLLLILILNFTSKKTIFDREKSSSFECGFDPKNSARMPFSLQFFLIAVIFLIFDIELSLLLPFILIIKFTNMMIYTLTVTTFIIILLLGLYHEWNQGALTWQI